MSSITQAKPRKRLSLPLTPRDNADLELIRRSPEHLRRLGEGLNNESSESAIVHAVFEKGLNAIKEQSMADAYALMAADEAEARESLANRERLTRRVRDLSTD